MVHGYRVDYADASIVIARNVSESELARAARAIGVDIPDITPVARGYRFRIFPNKSTRKYYRRGHSGRAVFAVCWHGHRDFFAEVFRRAPAARIDTAMIRYSGAADFQSKYPYTGQRNIGSMYEPLAYIDACDCAK